MSPNERQAARGLGLAIARQLTDLSGGSLTVRSRIDQGARFSLVVPFDRLPAGERKLHGRVIVVGDSDRTASLCRQLGDRGADVISVAEPSNLPATSGLKLPGQQALIFVEPQIAVSDL